jgi:hypothetical protein
MGWAGFAVQDDSPAVCWLECLAHSSPCMQDVFSALGSVVQLSLALALPCLFCDVSESAGCSLGRSADGLIVLMAQRRLICISIWMGLS